MTERVLPRSCRRCGERFLPPRDYYHSCLNCWRADQLSVPPDAATQVRLENARLRSELERLRAQVNQPRLELDLRTIRQLIQWSHPDKHANSLLATEITQKLLRMKAGVT